VSAADYKKTQRDGDDDDIGAEAAAAEPVVAGGGVPVAFQSNNNKRGGKSTNKHKITNDDLVLVAKSTNIPEKNNKRDNAKASAAANALDAVLTGLEVFGV
jgi:hypothetical protein